MPSPASPPPIPHIELAGSHDLNSDAVGAMPGYFRVDEGGAACYTLAIFYPCPAPLVYRLNYR